MLRKQHWYKAIDCFSSSRGFLTKMMAVHSLNQSISTIKTIPKALPRTNEYKFKKVVSQIIEPDFSHNKVVKNRLPT